LHSLVLVQEEEVLTGWLVQAAREGRPCGDYLPLMLASRYVCKRVCMCVWGGGGGGVYVYNFGAHLRLWQPVSRSNLQGMVFRLVKNAMKVCSC